MIEPQTKSPMNKELFFPGTAQSSDYKRTLNLQEKDPICRERFIKLIKQQEKNELGFILAHVITRKNNNSYEHWYAAETLNKWLFNGEMIPCSTRILNPMNPVNRITIQNPEDVTYFAIHDTHSNFFHLGTLKDFQVPGTFLSNTIPSFLMAFHSPEKLKDYPVVFLHLGKNYSEGIGNIPQDFDRAEKYYSSAATQESDKRIQAESFVGLAALFMQSKPIALRDYAKSLDYLMKAYNQRYSNLARREGCFGLALAHQYGRGVIKNLKTTRKYLKEIISESTSSDYNSVITVPRAHLQLARIYYEQQKYKKYLETLEPLAKQNNFLDLKADAQLGLAQFYSRSFLNNSKDLDKSEYYYDEYLANPSISENERLNPRYRCAMALLGDGARLEKAFNHFRAIASSKLISEQGKEILHLHMANIALRASYAS